MTLVLAGLLGAGPLLAQPTSPPPEPPATDDAAPSSDPDQAKARFERGRELFKQQSWDVALAEFLEARRLYPTWTTTAYIAASLKRLGRYGEAFEVYEVLLRDFGDKLSSEAEQKALRDMAEVRALVGTIEITGAEEGASVVVDQKARGEIPLPSPLHVDAGSHVIRVSKPGYEPFEARVDVAGITTLRVAARLRRLKEGGTLKVVEPTGKTLRVVVDGITAGDTPLEALIAPGEHVVSLRGEGQIGAMPTSVTIRKDEVEILRLEAGPLDARLRIEPTPADALVSLDSVTLGRGVWEGEVRHGEHTIEVAAHGFLTAKRTLFLGRNKRDVIDLRLERDVVPPFKLVREPVPVRALPAHFTVELGIGVPLVASLWGEALGGCTDPCERPLGVGVSPVLRAGYELGSGLSFGLTAGYLTAAQVMTGRATQIDVLGRPDPHRGVVDDALHLRGTLLGGWMGYSLGTKLLLHLRLGVGGLIGALSDERAGSFKDSTTNSYAVGPYVQEYSAGYFFVAPEVRGGLVLMERLVLMAGLEVPVLVATKENVWDAARQPVTAGADGPGTFSPAPASLTAPVFALFVPGVSARYDFY